MRRVAVLTTAVVLLLAACDGGVSPDLEVLERTARLFALDHDPSTATVYLLAGSRETPGFEVGFGAHDLVTGTTVVHVDGLPTPRDGWVGVDRSGLAWAFGGGLSWDVPSWLWRVDAEGTVTEVEVVRLEDVGCDLFDEGGVEELGVVRDGTVLHPKLLLIRSPDGRQRAVEVARERAGGPGCGPERRDLEQVGDLERNLQPLAVDAWLATARAAPEVRWVDPDLGLAVSTVPSRRLWANQPCEREAERVVWAGRTYALGSCYHSLGVLPTSGHLAVDDDALVVSHAGAVVLLRR